MARGVKTVGRGGGASPRGRAGAAVEAKGSGAAVKAKASGAAAKAKTAGTAKPKAKRAGAPGRTGTRLDAAAIEELFTRLRAQRPDPRSELEHSNPFTLLVAVVLSAQATDAGVNKATRGLFAAADTPAKMVALGEDQIREHIKTIGLFRGKAKNVLALSRILVEEHGGAVPADRAALERLPGVGRKTANVVLNVAFGEPTIAVDTHIFRVGNRTGLAPGRTPDEVEQVLLQCVPAEFRRNAHHWLILHGRYTCLARKPRCGTCVVADLCQFEDKCLD
ncbi:MAG: endonuclease III [Hyphomicrobiaceae bacterium]